MMTLYVRDKGSIDGACWQTGGKLHCIPAGSGTETEAYAG